MQNNQAGSGGRYITDLDDIALHDQQIDSTDTWTQGYSYIYNNLDVVYTQGSTEPPVAGKSHTVTVISRYLDGSLEDQAMEYTVDDGQGFSASYEVAEGYQLRDGFPGNASWEIDVQNNRIYIESVTQDWLIILEFEPIDRNDAEVRDHIDEINAEWSRMKPSFLWPSAGYAHIYEKPFTSTAPYAAGSLEEDYLQDALNMLNFHRYLADLPAVGLDSHYSNLAQHAAVTCRANNLLTHSPQKPDDMDDDFYRLALSGASSNMSRYNTNMFTLAESVTLYLYDSDNSNIPHLGHRRWALSPTMQNTGFGQANDYAAMYVRDGVSGDGGYDYINYPHGPAFPNNFFKSDYGWSVSLSQYQYATPSKESIRISLQNEEGQSWEFYDGCSDIFYIDTANYGKLSYCLIFRPDSGIISYEGKYDVSITGLKWRDGTDAPDITYSVTFFALDQPVNFWPQISRARNEIDFRKDEYVLGPVVQD